MDGLDATIALNGVLSSETTEQPRMTETPLLLRGTERRGLTMSQANTCPTCGERFRSNAAFDKHRIGLFNQPFEPWLRRRCATVEQMEAKGMSKNNRGQWITAKNPEFADE